MQHCPAVILKGPSNFVLHSPELFYGFLYLQIPSACSLIKFPTFSTRSPAMGSERPKADSTTRLLSRSSPRPPAHPPWFSPFFPYTIPDRTVPPPMKGQLLHLYSLPHCFLPIKNLSLTLCPPVHRSVSPLSWITPTDVHVCSSLVHLKNKQSKSPLLCRS